MLRASQPKVKDAAGASQGRGVGARPFATMTRLAYGSCRELLPGACVQLSVQEVGEAGFCAHQARGHATKRWFGVPKANSSRQLGQHRSFNRPGGTYGFRLLPSGLKRRAVFGCVSGTGTPGERRVTETLFARIGPNKDRPRITLVSGISRGPNGRGISSLRHVLTWTCRHVVLFPPCGVAPVA